MLGLCYSACGGNGDEEMVVAYRFARRRSDDHFLLALLGGLFSLADPTGGGTGGGADRGTTGRVGAIVALDGDGGDVMRRRSFYILLALAMLALAVMACASAAEPVAQATPTPEPATPVEVEEPTAMPVEVGEPAATPVEVREPTATEEPIVSGLTPMPPEPPSTPEPTPEIEERRVEVEWPAAMRVGDNDVLRLSLIPAPDGTYVPTPEIGGHEVDATPIPVTVARPGYTGYARATLSASGLNAELASPEEQPLAPGQPNTWRWTVSPDEAGTYRVVLSLSVRWVPEEGSGSPGPFEDALWERILTVEARSTFGLSGIQADIVGAGGSVLGLVTGIPFAEKGLEILLKRLKQWRGKARKVGGGA
jgi:outer membrane biosynthesis protein TonB